ncbi:putative tetratricopeptide-like helical domain superfamily [Helianthus annuus]|nr:putative tetratricopeptide-like helical domain superfamily [Helianthus annuus]
MQPNEKAETLFTSTQDIDLISWNTMISGYAQNGNSRFAQLLFKKLMHRWFEMHAINGFSGSFFLQFT